MMVNKSIAPDATVSILVPKCQRNVFPLFLAFHPPHRNTCPAPRRQVIATGRRRALSKLARAPCSTSLSHTASLLLLVSLNIFLLPVSHLLAFFSSYSLFNIL
jgi:hypothetical protein